MNIPSVSCLFLGGVVLLSTLARGADAPATLEVWPGAVPGETASIGPEKILPSTTGSVLPKQVLNVTRATLTVFKPAPGLDTGVAVIVCPGGGYRDLEMLKEGEDAARWLNSIGITGLVLKYRVPGRPGLPRHLPALQDAQRALSIVRSNAAAWGLRPDKIGIMGFSAGAHLSVMAATQFEHRAYPAIDAVDQVDCRPDFAIVIYPGGLLDEKTKQLSSDVQVRKNTSQMFIAQAETDRVNSENSILLYLDLKRAGVSAEMHLYAVGAHGFGLRPTPNPHGTWMIRCQEWMTGQGIWKPKN